jgi:hypothetical protein
MLRLNLLSVCIASIVGLLFSVLLNYYSGFKTTHGYYSLAGFTLFCFASNLVYAARAGNADFTGLLIAGIVIKLLLALVVVFLYAVFAHAGFTAFVLHFIPHYVLFTIFEIRYLSRLIQLKSTYENN